MPNGRSANVRSHRRGGGRRTSSPWLVLGVVALLVAGGLTAGWTYLVHRSCSGTDTAVVDAAPDIAPILSQLNTQWARTKPAVGGTCVSVSVNAKASDVMAAALSFPWDPDQGPAPDVWVPESSVWIQKASTNSIAQNLMPELQPSLARSPSVIAMPKQMALALGWPNKIKFDWPDIIADTNAPNFWKKQGWGAFKFTMTNPQSSTSGLLTLMSAVDRSDDGFVDTTTGQGDEQPNIIDLAEAMRKQNTLGDTSDITTGLLRADTTSATAALSYVSAFPALEQDVIKYNEKDPKEPLIAVYPASGSYDADNPYLVLNHPSWGTPGSLVAAKAFEAYVRGPQAKAAFLNAGYRDANRDGAATFSQANGVLDSLNNYLPRSVLDPASVVNTLLSYSAATRPMNVLLAIDVSTSMDDVVAATGGKTRLQLAKAAANSALAQFDPQSNVGLWEFSSNLDGSRPYKSLVPLGPLSATISGGKTRQQDLSAAISALQARTSSAQGHTGLYETIDQAQKAVVPSYVKGAANLVVVITDGQDDPVSAPGSPQIDLSELEVDLTHAKNSDKDVPIVTIGLSSQADLKDLADISRTSGGVAYDSPTGFDIEQVLATALFGQIGQS